MFAELALALPFLLVAAWLAWSLVKIVRASKRESRERRDALEELELCEPETDFGFADCPNRLDEPKSLARDMAETVRKSAPLLVCALALAACGNVTTQFLPAYKRIIPPESVFAAAEFVRAYIAAEDFALRSGSRDVARQCLEDADDAIENWAQSRYGDDWRDLVRAAMEPCKASEPVVMENADS